MPTLTVDGRSVTVPAGTKVIEAATKAGVWIPRYCYHPGLSIAGNCRMCMVEVEKNPKLQISCHMEVAEGMVVHTDSERVKQAREAVLEFLLINHPLDCPVCDQSGECDLQNFYMNYGLYDSKMREDKVKKHKAVPLGPTVMLDSERCVLCSRCVRYTDEITKTHEFGIFNRGDHAEVGLYPGTELNNPYSGNVVDICPVGALTDRDFRFKLRVWYLGSADSVCNGCSRGCNTQIHFNNDKRPHHAEGARVMRIKPRENADVNKWWICDAGRYGYPFIDEHRIKEAQKNEDNATVAVTRDEALSAVTQALADRKAHPESIAVIGSAQLTNEDAFALRRLFVDTLKVKTGDWTGPAGLGDQDDFLVRADKNPNTAGVEAIFKDIPKTPSAEIFKAVDEGRIKALFVFGQDLAAQFGEPRVQELRKKLELFVYQGSNENKTIPYAHWVVPSSVYAEKDGTFTNFQGRVQRIFQAVPPLGQSLGDWEIFQTLAVGLGDAWGFKKSAAVFAALAGAVPSFQGLTLEKVGKTGALLADAQAPQAAEAGK